jgi:glycosyltransferase involved in cell wall biosynthesis
MNGNVAFLLDMRPPTWSSREEFHARLCAALRQRGGAPVVALSGEPPEAIRRRLEASGAEVVALPYRGVSLKYFNDLRNLIETRRISLVHIHYFDYFSALHWLARRAGARRIVFTDTNSGEWNPHTRFAGLVRLRAIAATTPVSRLIAISDFIRQRLISLGLPPEKIAVVYYGVDLDRYSAGMDARDSARRLHGIAPGEVVISTIAVIRAFKHPETLVEALAALVHRGLPVRFLFAGDGPMRPDLEKMAQRMGVAGRIVWLGHSPEPWTVLQASDIFAFASVGEAFGFAVAEAMACGLPVVAARSGALPELVEDGRTGLIARPCDSADFADKLQRLVEDRETRERFARCSLERARALFGVDTSVSRTLEVYDQLE